MQLFRFVALATVTMFLLAAPSTPAEEETIIAWVGDRTITEREFQLKLSERYAQVIAEGGDMPPNRHFRLAVLNEMVRGKLTQVLAKNKGMTATDEEVASALRDFTRLQGGAEALDAWLETHGLEHADLVQRLTEKVTSEKLLHHFAEADAPEEDAIRAEFDRLEALGATVRLRQTADVAHIFVEAKDDSEAAWDAARETVEAARARIESGESFHDVAREVSEDIESAPRGGRYTEVSEGEVPAAIEERMFDLEPGLVSEPFRSELGWHVMIVETVNEEGTEVTFEKARDRIHDVLALSAAYERLARELAQLQNITRIELRHTEAQTIPIEPAEPQP